MKKYVFLAMCSLFGFSYGYESLGFWEEVLPGLPKNLDLSDESFSNFATEKYSGEGALVDLSKNFKEVSNRYLYTVCNELNQFRFFTKDPSQERSRRKTFLARFKGDEREQICFAQKIVVSEEGSQFIHIGDLHGNLHALLAILKDLRERDILNDEFEIIKNNVYIVITGDLGDRGAYGIEVYFLAMLLKIKNPKRFFITRGNHEFKYYWQLFSSAEFGIVLDEFGYKAPASDFREIKNYVWGFFQSLPLFILFTTSDGGNIIACHGVPELGFPYDCFLKREDVNIISFLRCDLHGFRKWRFKELFGEDKNFYLEIFSSSNWGFFAGDISYEKGINYDGKMRLQGLGFDFLNEFMKGNFVNLLLKGHQHNKGFPEVLKEENKGVVCVSVDDEGPCSFGEGKLNDDEASALVTISSGRLLCPDMHNMAYYAEILPFEKSFKKHAVAI